MNTNPKV